MGIPATFISSTQFSIEGEFDHEYPWGRKLTPNQGADGTPDVYVIAAEYDAEDDLTLITVDEAVLTANLVDIKKGVGDKTSVGIHLHTGKDDAGYIPASQFSAEDVEKLIWYASTLPSL